MLRDIHDGRRRAMRCLLLASMVFFALSAADSALGGWRTFGTSNHISPDGARQRGYRRLSYGQFSPDGYWRTYDTANRISPDGLWWRGYGRMGYGWYSVYGNYIGSDYSSIGFGYRNRPSGLNFNRIGVMP